tara:strand:+ start:147 stop:374 length:228 start_codon:yes stop_codon:yes gene_type:complete
LSLLLLTLSPQVNINLIGGGEDGEDLKVMGVQVHDKENGQYVVSYIAKHAGQYHIDVMFMGMAKKQTNENETFIL